MPTTAASLTTAACPAKEMESPCASSPSHSDNIDPSFISTASSNADSSQLPTGSQDNERRRRKRTTAQDKAILEAAYQRDTKPDKQARLDIVSRVSMNEKEVQIWFQNRRQNDRRKTRPLSIHEVESLRYRSAGVHIAPSTTPGPVQGQFSPAYSVPPGQGPYPRAAAAASVAPSQPPAYDPVHASSHETQTAASEVALPPSRSSSPRDMLPNPQLPPLPPGSVGETSVNTTAASLPSSSSQAMNPDQSFSSISSCSQESTDGVGYFSNRRNNESFASSQPAIAFCPELALPSINPDTSRRRAPLSHLLNDTTPSPFKITLSLDGKAELAPSISPPRPHHSYSPYDADSIPRLPPRLGHAHAHSGSSTITTSLPPISSLLNDCCAPPRLSRGSSRNAQTWEQIADSSDPTPTAVTDSLTTQAEDEVSGSARAVISLIRQHSSSSAAVDALPATGVLANNNGKRNATTVSHNARGGKKARLGLGRAMSSLARLETERTGESDADKKREEIVHVRAVDAAVTAKRKGKGGSDVLVGSPTDSDKENWSPDSSGNPHPHQRRQLVQPSRAVEAGRKVLEESMPVGGGKRLFFLGPMASDKKGAKNKRRTSPGVSIFEDVRSDDDGSDKEEADGEDTSAAASVVNGTKIRDDVVAHSFDTGVADEEVERFMRGDVSPSKKVDADAVHGLLSLKGGWSS